MDIGGLIALVLLGILGLFVIISALIGLGRGLKKTLGSTVVTILSVIIAILLTVLVFRPVILNSTIITEKIGELLQDSDFAEILEMPAVANALNYYICMLLAPFAFVLLFFVVRIILGIVMLIVRRFIPILNKLPGVAKRLGGLGVGAVNGFIWCLILFMPLLGTVNLVNTVVSSIDLPAQNAEENIEAGSVTMLSSEQTSEMDEISQYISPIVDSGAGKVLLSCGGDLMYDSLASANYYGEKVKLSNEATVIVNMVNDITSVDEDENMAIVAVDAVVEGIGGSPIIKSFAADLLSEASQAWINGETFMGMEKISLGETFDPMMDVALEILATESREYIYEDLQSISAFIHEVDEHGMLDNADSAESIIDGFGEQGTFADLLGSIEDNDRMVPLIDEVNAFAIRIFATNLDMMSDKQALYDDLMQSLAGTVNQYNNGMMTRDEANAALADALLNHGIDVEGEEIDNLTNSLLDEYDRAYEDMPKRVSEFFAIYLGTASGTLMENSNGTLSMGEIVLEKYGVSNYKDSQAYLLAVNGKSIGKAETLFSAESMETVVITADIILDKLVSYVDIEDRHAESEMIDAVMVSLIQAYRNMDETDMSASNVMAQMGTVLDEMHNTSVYGEAIKDFLTAVMQSNTVSESLGLNVLEMTDFANNINSGVTENTKYSNIATTVSQSINMLQNVNNGEASQEVIQDLMKDLTPETAQVMQNIATPSLMQSYGVGEQHAEKSSNAVSSLFGNMANYTANYPQSDMSDEEYKESIQKESEAVEKIVNISIKATADAETSESLFTTEEGDGSLDMSAYDVIDLFVTSSVASDTVGDLVNGESGDEDNFDPLGIENKMTETDKAELTQALDEYKANNSNVEGIDENLANIGAMFGIVYGAN